ncbi:MAG TPA: hypothetical protein VKL99_07065 [Candidatus Angelobacter sp.]|nr:hypothetical protein [Candidatus Angelobacter sp.]
MSITTVLALLSSVMSPIMAAACTGTGKAVSCHAVAMPHCDRAMHQHHHHDSEPASTSGLSAGESDAKCPMDCCTPGHPQSGAAPVMVSILPQLAVSDQNFHVVPVTFTSAGFSSHTDRGPPAA